MFLTYIYILTLTSPIYLHNVSRGSDLVVGLMVWGSNPGRGKRFFSSPKHQTDSGVHPASY